MQRMFLAIDDAAIPFRKNVGSISRNRRCGLSRCWRPALGLRRARRFRGALLRHGAARRGPFSHVVLRLPLGQNPDWPPLMMQQIAPLAGWFRGECPLYAGPICYAESDDGIHWVKPALGQVLFKAAGPITP